MSQPHFYSYVSHLVPTCSQCPRRKQHQARRSLRTCPSLPATSSKLLCTLASVCTHPTPCLSHLQPDQYGAHLPGKVLASWTVGEEFHPTVRDASVSHSERPDFPSNTEPYSIHISHELLLMHPKAFRIFLHTFRLATARSYFQIAKSNQNWIDSL